MIKMILGATAITAGKKVGEQLVKQAPKYIAKAALGTVAETAIFFGSDALIKKIKSEKQIVPEQNLYSEKVSELGITICAYKGLR